MNVTTVTRNGQITLSKAIREALDIREGTRLAVERSGNKIILMKRDFAFLKERESVLPANFPEILAELRKGKYPRYL